MLSIVAGLAVINAASALPSLEARKALCEKHPDKYVWVEKTEACVPINPCEAEDENVKNAYCNRIFKDYESPLNTKYYIMLVNLYAKKHGLDCTAQKISANMVGQDFVPCVGKDFMVFEFSDVNDADSVLLSFTHVTKMLLKEVCTVLKVRLDLGGQFCKLDGCPVFFEHDVLKCENNMITADFEKIQQQDIERDELIILSTQKF